MNKKLVSKVMICAIFCLNSINIYAHFEDIGASARAVGMGNAFTALANDASAIYYNPAGLALLKNVELMASYNRLYLGLTDNSNLGGGFASFVYPVNEEIGSFAAGWLNFYLAGAYYENTFTFSYSRKLMPSVFIGMNIKLLIKTIAEDEYTRIDPLFLEKGYNARSVSADLGMLWRFESQYSIGFMITDIFQPDLGFKDRDIVPLGAKVGFAYRYNALDLAIDFAYKSNDIDVYFGAEQWLFGRTIALRTGIGLGSREDRDITVGLGYRDPGSNFQLDYAFIYPLTGILNTYGSHRVSVVIRFGEVITEPEGEFAGASNSRTDKLAKEVDAVKTETAKLITSIEENKTMIQDAITRTESLKTKVADDMNALKEEIKKEREEILSANLKQVEGIRQEMSLQKEDIELTKRTTNELKEMMLENAKEIKKVIRITEDTNREIKKVKADVTQMVERPSTYVVLEGDTLMSIAKKLYGSEKRWVYLYMANQDRIIRGKVNTGQVLVIP